MIEFEEELVVKKVTAWSSPQGKEGYYCAVEVEERDKFGDRIQGLTLFLFNKEDFLKINEGDKYKLVSVGG